MTSQARTKMWSKKGKAIKAAPFMPEVWAKDVSKALADNIDKSVMQKVMEDEANRSQADPLAKAIIMAELLELFRMQPDLHLSQILDQVEYTVTDKDFAESITELVCSVRSEGKNDSSSDSPPADSPSRSRHRSTGPVCGELLSRRPCEPSPPSHALDALGYAQHGLSSPSEKRDTSCSKRR